ncbi:hypothetical protein [Aureimonas sp. AU40]|uniref:hypothetical protein n=1 Tax=Aureimonas sp. AU40 TaxID=1637747 RepID=UPI00078352A1|nr:hypothetical protein [Aureimonas sp. AU40]
MSLTPEQKHLARHALGLPNRKRRSYRNRFHAFTGGPDHDLWTSMVTQGLACVDQGKAAPNGSRLDYFALTRAGADAALEAPEKLDLEDFPPIAAH